jgi:hypothetical protein
MLDSIKVKISKKNVWSKNQVNEILGSSYVEYLEDKFNNLPNQK